MPSAGRERDMSIVHAASRTGEQTVWRSRLRWLDLESWCRWPAPRTAVSLLSTAARRRRDAREAVQR
jgi:hypothetical protein